MKLIDNYDSTNNYIGNADWQKTYTSYIQKSSSGLNYTAYWHDIFYGYILHKEYFLINLVLLKILFDLIFLVMGFFRCLRNMQFLGLVFAVVLYLVLLAHTPIYIWNLKKK